MRSRLASNATPFRGMGVLPMYPASAPQISRYLGLILTLSIFLLGCQNRTPAPTTNPTPTSCPNMREPSGSAAGPLRAASATRPVAKTKLPIPKSNYHLHLPGIGGYRNIDRNVVRGLDDGNLDGTIDHYDWTTADPGLGALLARQRNMDESNNVAQILLEHSRANPNARISVTAHSGGAGIIAWALEKLPDDVQIDTLVLLAPALSPTYDLTKALKHVRGHVYVFYSQFDATVLGVGTSLFGTIDGVKTQAAGMVGFKQPAKSDPDQYKKILQIPHDRTWIRAYGNMGDHVGTMNRTFAREVLAPLILTGKLPTTQPIDELTGRRIETRASPTPTTQTTR
ncbi:MAG TPA: hypothetical protein VF669_05495 [Tepidisphaeraceae bacterium]|jgi:pimeloyl-ACP methyl ester carboxylesterase